MTINKSCHRCMGFIRPVPHVPGWSGCSCGMRRKTVEIINLEDYITASGKYKDRLNSDELTVEVKDNAIKLLNKINSLLEELGIKDVKVSSGFRPSSVNAATKGAAKKSLHMTGEACDIEDAGNKLSHLILTRPELLAKHGLWLEDPTATPTWCHLDCSTKRKDRKLRVFKP